MKCYLCKKEITVGHLTYVEARNRREKSQTRTLCDDCEREHYLAKGFHLFPGINTNDTKWLILENSEMYEQFINQGITPIW